MRHAVASERRGHPRPRGGGRVRRRQVPRQRDAGNGGRGRSERSERSPLRGKLLPLRSSANKKIIARTDVPWSDVWRGSRRSMDTNRCHRASGCALEARRIAIAVLGDLQGSMGPGADGCAWQVGELLAKHRASRYALERCLEGFATLDGHKSVPSRERRCPGGPWNGDCLVR